MGGPSNTSLDILGIEVGRCAVRGVRLNQESAELVAAAECMFDAEAVSHDGVIDPSMYGPQLEDLLAKLGVRDRSQVRVGFTIGPRNSGVGSGPTMSTWLEAQAVNLREPMLCSGGLGIAFVPSRAVDAVLKLASGAGIDLVRVDLAPVAAARAIGDQVEDLICIGSGQGWQARMRDFEVLEAMENAEIGVDDGLAIFSADGSARTIPRYGWVEISAELDQAQRLDIGQLAPAVGAAIGVAYESPANLLTGKAVNCGSGQDPDPRLGTPGVVEAARAQPARRELPVRQSPEPSRSAPDDSAPSGPEPVGLEHLAGYELSGDGAEATLQLHNRANTERRADPPAARRTPRSAPTTALSPLRGTTRPESTEPDWGDSVDESDPITMFSPDTEVEQMMGKRDRRLSIDIFIGLLVVSAILLVLAYLYL